MAPATDEGKKEKLRVETPASAGPFFDLAHEPNRSVVEVLKHSDGKLIERIKAATTRKAIGERDCQEFRVRAGG
jgi:hypothetical protein